MADPGTKAAFAVLFAAYDRHKPHLYLLDEIYEREPEKTTVGYICPQIITKVNGLWPERNTWNYVYDVAGAWFTVDAALRFGLGFRPCRKRKGQKDDGIATLNEMFALNMISISDRCSNLIWEFDNYYKDKNGNYVKKHDHQIDNTRYLVAELDLLKKEFVDDEQPRRARGKKFFSMADDARESSGEAWADNIFNTYGEE